MSESKLWQLRAGLITEGEYQDSMGEAEDMQDPNISQIRKLLSTRQSNMKPVDTTKELTDLLTAIVDDIQALNHDALSDPEVVMTLRSIIKKHSNTGSKEFSNQDREDMENFSAGRVR